MEILNLSAAALFDALTRNNLERELLLEGTNLRLDEMLDVKKKHSWQNFLKMYDNVARNLGPEKAAREIAYTGIYNNEITVLRKIASGLLNVKAIYWFMSKVACRHLFKDAVKFNYRKIKSNQVQMEINISPELEDCPLLLETYVYLFENIPTMLGLPKARVTAEILPKRAIYTIKLSKTSYIFSFFYRFTKDLVGYSKAIEFMEELETQSLQLSHKVEVKSEILRVMSHDLSNSVAVIDMALSKLLKRNSLSDEDLKLVLMASKSSNQLRDILKNVQNIEVAYLKGINLAAVKLDEVFQDIDDRFREQFALKKIDLIIKNELPAQTRVLAEKLSLEWNVLPNLLMNAFKFSNPGTTITLRASLEEGSVVLSVEDQGKGISPEEIDELFSKKIRKSTLGTAGEVGSGLGLGIVRTYVQLYGGEISVKPNDPCGSIFKIYLKFSKT